MEISGNSSVEEGYLGEIEREEVGHILPADFKVYVKEGSGVINWAAPGFEARPLPTFNHYTGPKGGYIALYSREKEGSVYSVGKGIYVIGQIRVPGEYVGRKFSSECSKSELLEICSQYFPEQEGKFWTGNDTGGWFGIQR